MQMLGARSSLRTLPPLVLLWITLARPLQTQKGLSPPIRILPAPPCASLLSSSLTIPYVASPSHPTSCWKCPFIRRTCYINTQILESRIWPTVPVLRHRRGAARTAVHTWGACRRPRWHMHWHEGQPSAAGVTQLRGSPDWCGPCVPPHIQPLRHQGIRVRARARACLRALVCARVCVHGVCVHARVLHMSVCVCLCT